MQSNYFCKDDTTTYDRGDFHDVTEPLTTFHKYSIERNKNVGGDGPAPKSVKEYVYGDNRGSADSIKVKYGPSFDAEEKKTSDKNKPEPIGTEIEADASREKDNQSNPTIPKPNGGLISFNFTATPVGTLAPGNTGSSGQGHNDDVPQSAASRGTIQEGLIAGILFLVYLAAWMHALSFLDDRH